VEIKWNFSFFLNTGGVVTGDCTAGLASST